MYTRKIDKKKSHKINCNTHCAWLSFSKHVKFLCLLFGALSFIYLNNPQLAHDWSRDQNYLQYKQYASSKYSDRCNEKKEEIQNNTPLVILFSNKNETMKRKIPNSKRKTPNLQSFVTAYSHSLWSSAARIPKFSAAVF